MAPIRAPRLICRGVAAVPLCGAPSQQLVECQTGEPTPATPIQAQPSQFVLPHETSDVAVAKNVCNRERSPKQNLLQRPKAFRFARCEMVGDLSFPLLFRAIAKAREALPPDAREASQIRGHAKIHPASGHA